MVNSCNPCRKMRPPYRSMEGPAAGVAILSSSSVAVSYLLLLVPGTMTSYPPHCLGSFAGLVVYHAWVTWERPKQITISTVKM